MSTIELTLRYSNYIDLIMKGNLNFQSVVSTGTGFLRLKVYVIFVINSPNTYEYGAAYYVETIA